ncbi:major facilitator superfamily transporter [Apiospora marii]|uniref:major facilitator superfamily transporter n=1 Tax=Apiospora marii TaxID=335849 RepID=UPI00312F1E95
MAIHSLSFPPGQGSRAASGKSSKDVLIFMISGNPGLIDYYEPFLSALRTLLDSSPASKETQFHIYGQDLAGFNDDDHEPFSDANPPRDVAYQVNYLFETLSAICIQDEAGNPQKHGQPFDEVILIGHSVGTYLILQLFHEQLRSPERAPHLRLQTGILLFPTIEHIRHSPSGQRLELLRSAALLERHAHRLAAGFLRLWPGVALRWSRDGVWQALHMGLDEMRVIGEDQWDEELWEIEREGEAAAQRGSDASGSTVVASEEEENSSGAAAANGDKLPPKFFFFGKDDHWVANHFRDAFIERRQKQAERTRLMVDEGNLPHAFCIHHSEVVADKVASWINELYAP